MARKTEVERCEEACAILEPGGSVSIDAASKRGGFRAVLWSKNGKRELAARWGVTRTEAARELRTIVLRMLAGTDGTVGGVP